MRYNNLVRWLALTAGLFLVAVHNAQPILRWDEGRAYYYTLRLQARQQVSFEQIARLLDDKPSISRRPDYVYEYELQATVLIAPIQRIQQDWLTVWKFESPRVTLRAGEGSVQPIDTRRLQQQMQAVTVFVRLSPLGAIRAVWFTPRDATDAHDLLRAVLGRLQICLPDRECERWVAEEESPEGRYRAEYILERCTKKHFRFLKRRVNYIESKSPIPVPQILKPSDKVQIELREGVLYRVEGRFYTESRVNAKLIGSESTTVRFLWRHARPIETARLQAWRARHCLVAAQPESLSVPDRVPTPAQQRLADQQILGDDTLKSLQHKLAQLSPNTPFEQAADLISRWTALVRLHPELSSLLKLKIEALDIRSPQAQVLISALREAGHAQAQAALVELAYLYYQRGDADDYAHLMPNFAFLNEPNEATESALQKFAQVDNPAFANPARLALGSIGHRVRETHPDRARRLGAWMIRQLERAVSDSEREVWLLALGNLGLNDALPTIQVYLNAPQENLRAAATGALRFLTLSGIEALLLERLRDASRLVKLEAISALQYRTLSDTVVLSLREYLQQEPDKELRRALLEILHLQASKSSAVRELLRWAAQNDPDKDIRLYAESLTLDFAND